MFKKPFKWLCGVFSTQLSIVMMQFQTTLNDSTDDLAFQQVWLIRSVTPKNVELSSALKFVDFCIPRITSRPPSLETAVS